MFASALSERAHGRHWGQSVSRGAPAKVPLALKPLVCYGRTLRQGLDTLGELLELLRKGSYADCVEAISGLRAALRSLEAEESGRFHREEMKLCAALHSSQPDLQALMDDLAADREAMRQAFSECRKALAAFNKRGDSRELLTATDRLAKTLTRRLDRQQQELMPALERELRARESVTGPAARLADAS